MSWKTWIYCCKPNAMSERTLTTLAMIQVETGLRTVVLYKAAEPVGGRVMEIFRSEKGKAFWTDIRDALSELASKASRWRPW